MRAADAQGKAAKVQQMQAAVEAASLNLSYTQIVAPVDGVVTHKQVEPGQIVQQGQGLMVVVPLQDVWVTANFKETQLRNMKPGQKAEIHVDTYGKTFEGHVDSIAGATGAVLSLLPPENATGNYVKVVQRIPGEDHRGQDFAGRGGAAAGDECGCDGDYEISGLNVESGNGARRQVMGGVAKSRYRDPPPRFARNDRDFCWRG